LQKPPSRRTWLIPGFVAAILFIGAVASNLIASDLESSLRPYRYWVWLVFAIAFVAAVATAIYEGRWKQHSPVSDATDESNRTVYANVERNVAVDEKVETSPLVIGNNTLLVSGHYCDIIGHDKIINIQQVVDASVNALHQLRAPVGDFVGRKQEFQTLIDTLRSKNRAPISGINGMGGIGKTEFALFVANSLLPDYADAQFFINLQGTHVTPLSPQAVMAICIRAFLGPEVKLPQDLDQLSQLYRSQLSGKHVLLVLDNAANEDQVLPLLPPTGSALLVTSRQVMTLPGMMPLTLNPLTEKEARELLLEIAPRVKPGVDQIAKLCGYLPLAIRAAGSLLAITPDLDPIDYSLQLNDERTRLEQIGTRGVEIGVAASFNLSYARLAAEAARVFRLLSVFPSTFSVDAAEFVCRDATHGQLSDLVRRSLVLYELTTKRYRLHDLTRLFSDSKVSEEERVITRNRHSGHYRDILVYANALYKEGGESLARGLALFDLEWDNIQAGYAWVEAQAVGVEADQNMTRLAVTYPNLAASILELRLHTREWIRWLEIALASARRLQDRAFEANTMGNLGIAYEDLGDTQRAIQFHEEHLAMARAIGDRRGEGNALGNLGLAYTRLGEPHRAMQFQEQALLIDRELGDQRGEAIALGNLGVAYRNLGETDQAITLFEQQLTLAREVGDRRGEGNALGNLGTVYTQLGDTQRAIQFVEQRLNIAREIGDHRGEGNALGSLGIAYIGLGEMQWAIQHFEQQLIIVREMSDRRGEGDTLWNMSLALARLGKRAKAIYHAEQSLQIRKQINDPRAEKVAAQLAVWRSESEHY